MAETAAFARQFSTRLAMSNTVVARKRQPESKQAALPACTLKYALAISDPMSPAARGACVPFGSNASQKVTALIRFDTKFGTNGIAAFLAAPCTASNLPSVYYTTEDYTGTSSTDLFPWASSGSQATPAILKVGWSSAGHNGPYRAADLADLGATLADTAANMPQISARIVSAGYRVQYTGTTLNESGMFTCLQDPAHGCLSGQDIASIQTTADTMVEGLSRAPCTLRMHGVEEDEMEFPKLEVSAFTNGTLPVSHQKNLYPFSPSVGWRESPTGRDMEFVFAHGLGTSTPLNAGTLAYGCPSGVVIVSGKAGESLHVEITLHLEFIGNRPSAFYTPVTADPQGAQLVRTAALTIPAKMQSDPKRTAWDAIMSGIRAGWSELKPIAVPALKTAAEAALLSML